MKIDSAFSNRTLQSRNVEQINKPAEIVDRDKRSAEPEVASIYYLSTLQSLKEIVQPTFTQAKQSVNIAEKKKTDKGIIQTIKDWLFGCFGFSKSKADVEQEAESADEIEALNNSPLLSPPDPLSSDLLRKSISEVYQHLERLKECHQFEEEMRKSNSNDIDKRIIVQLQSQSILQRDLKQANSVLAQQELHGRRKANEKIQVEANAISEDLVHGKNIADKLKWINVALSAGIITGTAIAVFTGGISIISLAMPIASIFKGGATLTDGIVKFNNGKKEGELMLHKENVRANTAIIHDQLEVIQMRDEEIATVLKSLRKLLKDQSETERTLARFR